MALILEASTTLSFRIYHLYGVLATSHRLGIVIDTDLATTHGDEVFSLHSDNSPSHGFEDVLPCYRGFTPNFPLSEQPPVSCSGDWRRWAWTEMFRYGLGGTQTTRESNYFLTSYADCFSKCWRRAMGRHEEDG
ncbi:PREDICTED: uncharacterized protein LOC106343377 isoform X5 [Brassica oleracea var. oleracea]|uniref:uncharacterized protein LOC106343377 isoform X5 n=1 Tax=Brassica oleracea var. oleracea TaxID=109376 RepID=UPI0006A73BC6|nr:PREDICTED: uncharacterized protein LOC106343377 isoform X5 [Brassica oleracea var. oleracea]